MLEGVDLSSYQATTPGLGGLSFAIVRASIGLSADTMYATHARAIRKAGLELGAYHFGVNVAVGPQIAAFGRAYAAVPPDFVVLDLEGSGPASMTNAQAAAFVAASPCGVYGSESGYPDLGQSFRWVANWSKEPSIPWDIWQYTSSGHRPAYGGRLDLDRFDGTLAEFRTVTRGHTGGGNVGDTVKTITSPGYGVTSGQRLHVPDGTPYFDLTGAQLGTLSGVPTAGLVCIGKGDGVTGQWIVGVTLGGVATQVLVKAGTPVAAAVPPPEYVPVTEQLYRKA